MDTIDTIRSRIRSLYETNPAIHVNVTISAQKIDLRNRPVVLSGVYPHVFRIEDRADGKPVHYTLQYADVLTKNVEIMELETEGPQPSA